MSREPAVSAQASASGVGLGGLVFLVFLACKLTGNIDWSWWWVTAPLWIPVALLFAIVAVVFLVAGIVVLVDKVRS